MAKAAILMPYPELKAIFDGVIGQYPRLSPVSVEYVQTDRIAERAVSLEKEGYELIIARGLQARIAREAVLIPVIEMRASTQELEALVLELKQKVPPASGQRPRLGIIGFFNMFHSTKLFDGLLDIELKVYTVTDMEQYIQAVDQAVADGCLGVIGGRTVMEKAEQAGLASRFLDMGEESVKEALESASMVSYSIDLLKRSDAEKNAMLDNTSSALLQVDETGTVRLANHLFYQLLGKSSEEVVGQNVTKVIPGLPASELDDALKNGQETDASVVTLGNRTTLMSIMPVQVDNHVSGAILTFQESQRVAAMDSTLRKEAARQGLIAEASFDQIFAESARFQQVIRQLKRLSHYPTPVLLKGETGTGKGMLAQCIHNESLHRDGAFVMLDCSISHPDDLDEKLFGRFSPRKDSNLSAVELARGGTLYLRQVELLSPETQYKILQLIRGRYLSNGTALPIPAELRLVFSTEVNLRKPMEEGSFRKDLYFALNALRIDIPPLRERREDVPLWMNELLRQRSRVLGRSIHLSKETTQVLSEYDWPGNLDQMASLCDRLLLLSEKRTVTEEILREHLREISSERDIPLRTMGQPSLNARGQELLDVLNRCHGSRDKAAEELGISKTTLWRRMKKYGIARDLSVAET